MSSGQEGAYDLKKEQIPFLKEDVGKYYQNNRYQIHEQWLTNSAKPGLTALAVKSFVYYTLGSEYFNSTLNNTFY